MKLAVVKPDHIGDLILSSPAIRAITAAHPGTMLFVSSKCLSLARHLFPGLEIRVMDLPHLMKSGDQDQASTPDLTTFDLVAFLRRDGVMTPEWASLRTRDFIIPEDTHADHQSILDYAVAAELAPGYDMDALFYGERLSAVRAKALRRPKRIGFSIGSGFYANAWPLTRWIETGRMLQADGRELFIIGGPAERAAAEVLVRRLGLSPDSLIIGGADFGALFRRLETLDLVIAPDGGTAHLCALTTPLISLFGPSPVARYAPFGRWNRTLTLQLPCSPCCQYAQRLVNGCLSVECMNDMDAEDVRAALAYPLSARQRGHAVRLDRGRTLFVGLSHIDQTRKMAERAAEAATWAA